MQVWIANIFQILYSFPDKLKNKVRLKWTNFYSGQNVVRVVKLVRWLHFLAKLQLPIVFSEEGNWICNFFKVHLIFETRVSKLNRTKTTIANKFRKNQNRNAFPKSQFAVCCKKFSQKMVKIAQFEKRIQFPPFLPPSPS